jgi:hypothetical protein
LEEWANADGTPPPVDNGPLLCSHGKLDPGKVAQMKLISGTAWGQLQVGWWCSWGYLIMCYEEDDIRLAA